MVKDRSKYMDPRAGLLGWLDSVRYREIYRQTLGLLLVLFCALLVQPGHERVIVGFVTASAGQLFRVYAAGTIFKNRELATTGAYALVRHPLYLGNVLILGGFALASANAWLVAGIVLFFLIWYPAAIAYEDFKLERKFGEHWRAWSEGSNAILPRRFPWRDLAGAQWSARQALLRNGELWITVYLLACAVWLWGRAHG